MMKKLLNNNQNYPSTKNTNLIQLMIVIRKQNEVLMAKPVYLGFVVLKSSKLHMYEAYYEK